MKRKYGSEAVDEITRLIDEALDSGVSPDYRPINTYVETKTCVDSDGNVRVATERYDMDTELMAPVQGPPVPMQHDQRLRNIRLYGEMIIANRRAQSSILDFYSET